MSLPDGYAVLLDLSERMVKYAKTQDWNALTACEQERTSLQASLPDSPSGMMSMVEADALRCLLLRVKACDTEVLSYVEPWKEQVAKWIHPSAPATQ